MGDMPCFGLLTGVSGSLGASATAAMVVGDHGGDLDPAHESGDVGKADADTGLELEPP